MDVFDCIKLRRSVREYLDKPIPKEDLARLLNVLRAAPSAANRQPWKFIAVTDPEKRRAMVEKCGGQKFLAQAPVTIIGCGLTEHAWHGMGGDKSASSVDVDLAIALDHLTLAAAALGLGTCWVGAFDELRFKKLFNVPDNVKIVALTPLGYPKDKAIFRALAEGARKALEEIICYNNYEK
jgi:nitroreductase